ncbi:hypothetical protein ES332_D04G217100v1 [Gossypium tomentosum]|uniref:TF-B3 domain-containing protein n=1 Tax=Gossypium tomentosum TaxID=34277 RepID=A0A5D2LJT4_GOSTO|nr:hypothetical protein ES332_D04G217100v1 [Gossypium tomentosum]
MTAQSKHVFSKILTVTDIKKRLAVPSAIQRSLPPFNGGHTVTFQFLYGTRPWPIRYTIRRKGYKKPVFSGKLWKNFVIYDDLNVGDRFILYIGQGEDGSSYYKIINRSHQGLLQQPTTPYGAELDLTLALAPLNVEGNTMIGSMARL